MFVYFGPDDFVQISLACGTNIYKECLYQANNYKYL